ncbi:MAG: SDR family oxidoreductase [Euryarchaeota archaeon]|nr:SDR family oxidoreductase [Euryarchaeota archaeon]
MNTGLKDKTVLITGASGGIGTAAARLFAREGAKLVLQGRNNMETIAEMEEELPVPVLGVQADLTKKEDIEDLFEQASERFGEVNILIANAGIWPKEDVPIHKMSLAQWNRTVAIDQTAVFLCCREFFRVLQETQPKTASLVLIGSTAAVFGEEGHADYAAAKAAIAYGLMRSLKNEIVRIVPSGRVNAVCPGWTLTGMTEEFMDNEELIAKAVQTKAIKKIARPEDIANAVLFLSSPTLSGHTTGEILTVSGGMEGRVLHTPEDIDTKNI